MEFIYFPPSMLGDIRAGMDRQSLRATLGTGFEEFRKSEFFENTTDAFQQYDLHVYYDLHNCVKGAEVFRRSQVVFHGVGLIGFGLLDVAGKPAANGVPMVEDSLGGNFLGNALRLYCPDIDEDAPNALVHAVYVALG